MARRRKQNPLPAIAAITPALAAGVTGATSLIAALWGGKKQEDVLKERVRSEQDAARREMAAQQAQLATTMELQNQQRVYEVTSAQRSNETRMLWAVGGVAVLAAGFFVYKAMQKKGRK